jgi:hypothetical protein
MNADELCPGLCPNGCLRSTYIVTYEKTPRDMFEVLRARARTSCSEALIRVR